MILGDHLVADRGAYTHHGLYVGKGRVIHYSGLSQDLAAGPVTETSLEAFSGGWEVRVRRSPGRAFGRKESVRRARSRLGEAAYRLSGNNCEHFVAWCIYGVYRSRQVDTVVAGAGPAQVGMVGLGATSLVGSAGSVAGLSGPGLMSGLAAIGPGGAVGGVVTLAGGAGLGTVAVLHGTVLRDDVVLAPPERRARRVGRACSVGAAGGATAAGVAAISASGSVAGLSGAGIMSGLAAIGAGTGVSAAAGVSAAVAGTAVVVAAPAAAALVAGLGAYRVAQWLGAPPRRKRSRR